MAEETTSQFLDRRETELTNRIAALRGQLTPLEAELRQVQRMRSLLGDKSNPPTNALASAASRTIAGGGAVNALASGPLTLRASGTIAGAAANALSGGQNPYAERTIKDLVIQALIDGFSEGANTKQLRNFILNGYHRDIDAATLRTQLHRLKGSGILGRDELTDTWNFQQGQRALYARYDHPTSRKNDVNLQDEPYSYSEVDWDDPFTKKAQELAWKDGDDQK